MSKTLRIEDATIHGGNPTEPGTYHTYWGVAGVGDVDYDARDGKVANKSKPRFVVTQGKTKSKPASAQDAPNC